MMKKKRKKNGAQKLGQFKASNYQSSAKNQDGKKKKKKKE